MGKHSCHYHILSTTIIILILYCHLSLLLCCGKMVRFYNNIFPQLRTLISPHNLYHKQTIIYFYFQNSKANFGELLDKKKIGFSTIWSIFWSHSVTEPGAKKHSITFTEQSVELVKRSIVLSKSNCRKLEMSYEECAPIMKGNQARRSKHDEALMGWDLMP